jgi:hypothetical protein
MHSGFARKATEESARAAAHGRRLAGACAVIGVLALAGCGSSSTSVTPADTAFINQANGACRTAYAKERAVRPPNGGNESSKQVVSTAPKLAVIAQAMLGQLSALTPPASEQGEYDKMLSAWRREIAAAATGDKKTLTEERSQVLSLAEEFDSAATKLGLTVCAGNA